MEEARTPSGFTLGTVQLGMDYGMANATGKPSHEEAFHILDEAWRVGAHSLDTAVAYGESERVIGAYLAAQKKPFFLTSKFKVTGENPKAELAKQADQTKKNLGRVDVYMFHAAEQLKAYGQLLEEPLRRMQEDGFCGRLGASVYELADIETFLKFEWLQAIQIPMSILDTRIAASGLLEELKRRGVLVFVRSVFFQGLLCMEHAPEEYAFLEPYIGQLREVAEKENRTLKELAVTFIRDLPGVTSVVLGCESAAQVSDNSAMFRLPPVSRQGISEILEIGKRVPAGLAMDHIMGRC